MPRASLKLGDVCPDGCGGKVYPQRDPGVLVRIKGQAPLTATVYELKKLQRVWRLYSDLVGLSVRGTRRKRLQGAMRPRGAPVAIRSDNGPELSSRHFLAWCIERLIDAIHIQPGKRHPQNHLRLRTRFRKPVGIGHRQEPRLASAVFTSPPFASLLCLRPYPK